MESTSVIVIVKTDDKINLLVPNVLLDLNYKVLPTTLK